MTHTYVAPTSLDDALAAMAAGARPVAGGTDLVVGARQGKAPLPDDLLAIHRIEALLPRARTRAEPVPLLLVSHSHGK